MAWSGPAERTDLGGPGVGTTARHALHARATQQFLDELNRK